MQHKNLSLFIHYSDILDGEIPILKCKSSYSCALISKLKSGLSFTTEYIDDQKLFKSKLEVIFLFCFY